MEFDIMNKMTETEVKALNELLMSAQGLHLEACKNKSIPMVNKLNKIMDPIYTALDSDEAKVFKCECCGHDVGIFNLIEDRFICGKCYKKESESDQ